MKRKRSKVLELHSTTEMIGINQAWRIETKDEITFFVSPAVYTLLEDESVADQVIRDIRCREINYAIKSVLKMDSELKIVSRFNG